MVTQQQHRLAACAGQDAGALVSVLDDHSGGEMPINLLWARSQHMPLKVRVLVDALLLAAQQSGSAFRAT